MENKILRILTGSDTIQASVSKRKVTDTGELRVGINMHDALKYKDYNLELNLTGFKSYDKKSDKILTLNKKKNYIIVNSNYLVSSVTGAIGDTKESVSTVSEVAGLTLILSNPATAGVFVQLNQVVKLIDKLRYLNVVFGGTLSSFINKLSGIDTTKEQENPNKDEDSQITIKYGKLTKLHAKYVLDLGTYIKVIAFLVLFFLRLFVYNMRNNLLNKDGEIIKWKVYLTNIHYTVEFMGFNSAFNGCLFPILVSLLYSIYKVRIFPLFDLVMSIIYLIITTYYLLEMLRASKSIKYSLNLNNLSSIVFQDYSKFEKQMMQNSKFREKHE